MNDTTTNPDHAKLFGIASEQAGYFTTAQAHDAGFSSPLIRHHVRTGRFVHVARGLYRLRDYPSTQREEVGSRTGSLGIASVPGVWPGRSRGGEEAVRRDVASF